MIFLLICFIIRRLAQESIIMRQICEWLILLRPENKKRQNQQESFPTECKQIINYANCSQIQMSEQIKPNNKNNQKPSNLPIKIAFQANIFKYVQKKKRQLSVFAALNQNQSHQKDKHSSTSSNLIKQNTAFNFYRLSPNNTIDPDMLLSARIKLIDRKLPLKGSILKKKAKGHKYSLSDWRILYEQRDRIIQKREIIYNSPDKMAATDRLFYPAKNQCSSLIQKSCSRHKIKQKRERDEMCSEKQDKFFVSDQNFFHMYHRSVTPIKSDYAEKKRIAKYLNLNKERRDMKNGLRLMNEGIFSDFSKNDVAFVPYKFQPSQSRSKLYNLEENLSSQIIKHHKKKSKIVQGKSEQKEYNLSQIMRANKTHMEKFVRNPKQDSKQQVDRERTDSDKKYSKEQNPQSGYLSPSKDIEQKNHINLSESFQNPQGNKIKEHKGQLRLKLFKPRKNKIQSAISNTKKTQSENKFAHFQYSIKLHQSRNTFLNTTKHSNSKWTK